MSPASSRRWNPAIIGFATAATLAAAFVITEFAIGRLPGIPASDRREVWIAIAHCLLLGALLGGYLTVVGRGADSLAGLRAAFPQEGEDQLRYVPATGSQLVVSGILGALLVGVGAPFLTTISPWSPSTWPPEVYWHRVLGPALGFLIGLTLFAFTRESMVASRAAARLGTVDLFAPERFAPLVSHGITNVLVAAVLTSVGALFLFVPDQAKAIGTVWAVMLPVMITGIVLPVWGARSRLRQAKQREMEWALKGIREARGQDPVDTEKLGDLSAYYDVVDRAPEWPFTQTSFIRLAFYFLIPAVAWLIAVLLEGFLQTALLGG